MRLFAIVLLAFFASLLSFKRERFVISEFLFLLTGLVLGMFLKNLNLKTYKFFETFLIGFFGIIYGMSMDIRVIIKSAKRSIKLAFLEFFLGLFYLLIVSSVFHPHNISINDKLSILSFIMITASSYFIKYIDQEKIVASFFLPSIVSTVIGFFTFEYKGFFILLSTVLIIGFIFKIVEKDQEDNIIQLSIILGSVILVSYIALRFGESPFFFSFLLGLFIVNISKSTHLFNMLFMLKEDEKLLFLTFLFVVGLFTNLNLKVITEGIIIFLLRLFYKFISAKLIYSKESIPHFLSSGGLAMVIGMDIIGHGKILKGWGAAIIIAYILNTALTILISIILNTK